MNNSKLINSFMRRFALYCAATVALIVWLSNTAVAEQNGFFQQNPKDSVPQKVIRQVRVTVKDLMDGVGLDSVFVTAGSIKEYTSIDGFVQFENVQPETMIIASKAGYLVQAKKAKSNLQIRLVKREMQSSANDFKNGLYTRPAEHFSGSATTISGNDLRKVSSLNFVEALKYYDPSFIVTKHNNYGDDPNATPSVKIRGAYNFPASATIASQSQTASTGVQLNPSTADFVASNVANPNQPVILLNGIQVALQTALDIDINRIDQVTILKDAAATSLYGVRGGNGIVLIQTRAPQKGTLNVTYSGQVQVTTPDLSSYHLMDAPQKLLLEHDAGMYTNNPSLYSSRWNRVDNGVNTRWLGIPTRTGIGQKHYLSLDGGDDDINYGLDFSYNDIEGVMKGSNRQTANFGGYVSARIKHLEIGNYLTYTKSNASNSPYGSFADYSLQNGYWSPYDSITGDMVRILEKYTYQGNTVKFYNPAYNGIISTTDDHAYSRISNLTSLNWLIGHGFRFDGRFGISKQSDEDNVFLPPTHTAFANYSPNDFFKRGKYNQTLSDFLSMEGALNLHYNKSVGLHQFYASGGVSALETRSESAGVELVGFTSDKLTDLAFGSAYSNQRPTTGRIVTRLGSGYGNFTYSYNNRYQLEVTGNADRSSQFGENNGIAPHWSAGASWNVHQERFFHSNKILNQLRVRASVGTAGNLFYQSYLGNTNYNYYTDRQYVQAGSNIGTRGTGLGAFLTGFGNDDLKAPVTEKANIGLDAVLLNNRLSVRVDVYKNNTNDIVLPVVSPASSGFQNFVYYDNLGAIENKGLEFDLNYNIIRDNAKGITWTVRLNGIYNRDRIVSTSQYLEEKLNPGNDVMSTDQTRPQPRYLEGYSPSTIWAVQSLGIDPATGQEKFLKLGGSQTTSTWYGGDKIGAGNSLPDWLGSFGTTVSIKNISAGVYFNYQLGAEVYNQTLADRVENADLTYNVDKRAGSDRWMQAGDNALYKKLSVNGLVTSPTYVTTRFIESNDFINCSAISASYSFSQHIVEKIRAKNLKLGFIANNVFRSGNQNYERGIYYPFHRMYSFSVTAGF